MTRATYYSLLLLVGMAAGCLNSISVKVVPDANLSEAHTFYVVKRPTDKHDIHVIVAKELRRWGRTATHGLEDATPAAVDVVVTTDDHWFWDLRMYLTELQIDFRDPQTDEVLVTAVKKRGSLDATSPEHMTWETLVAIFEKTNPNATAPAKPEPETATK